MAKRGPKPTPRNLRLVKGTDRPDRINDDEPIVPVSVPDAPDCLTDVEARKFTDTARKLASMRVMTEADIDALVIFAKSWVQYLEADDMVRDMGLVIRSPTGYPMQNPYLAIKNKAQANCLNILTEFGLTPSSRTRVRST